MRTQLQVRPFADLDAWSTWDAANCDRCQSSGSCDIEAQLVDAFSAERKDAEFGFISRKAAKRLAIDNRVRSVCGEFRREGR